MIAQLARLRAPAVDLPTFSGDPLEYPHFLAAFRNNIDSLQLDDAAKVLHLVQLCRGEAAHAIRGCLLLPPTEGYRKARRVLDERYGDASLVTESWVEKLTKDERVGSLRVFADDMATCIAALTSLDAMGELDAVSNMKRIVARLPTYLQVKWRTEAVRIKRAGGRPRFQDLHRIVELAADEENDPSYGRIVGGRSRESPHTQKGERRGHKQTARAFTTTTATTQRPCLVCNGSHRITQCSEFTRSKPAERRDTARRLRLCYACLKPGHQIGECRNARQCGVNGCSHMHHRLLHGGPPQTRASPRRSAEPESRATATVAMTTRSNVYVPPHRRQRRGRGRRQATPSVTAPQPAPRQSPRPAAE